MLSQLSKYNFVLKFLTALRGWLYEKFSAKSMIESDSPVIAQKRLHDAAREAALLDVEWFEFWRSKQWKILPENQCTYTTVDGLVWGPIFTPTEAFVAHCGAAAGHGYRNDASNGMQLKYHEFRARYPDVALLQILKARVEQVSVYEAYRHAFTDMIDSPETEPTPVRPKTQNVVRLDQKTRQALSEMADESNMISYRA